MMLRHWKTAALVVGLATLASAGASPAEAGKDLAVKRFLLGRLEPLTDRFIATGARGTTNAFRDNVLMFVFSGPVDFDSLNDRTVKIGIPSTGGLFIAAEGEFYRYSVKQFNAVTGEYEVKRTYKNRYLFDPTKRQNATKKNPYGFAENSTFSVTLEGLDAGTNKTVRGAGGEYLTRTFVTSFRTTAKYLQDYTQPYLVSVEGSDAPGVPLEGRSSVDSKADVIARFSEPMLLSAFDPKSTFTVFNQGTGQPVSGTIRASPDGLSFTYRPVFGYGRGPFQVTVTIASSLSDRSGNVVAKGVVVNFVSEEDPFAPNFDEVVESFDLNTFEDQAFTPVIARADWAKQKTPGILIGIIANKSLDIIFGGTSGHGIPWWNSTAHTQFLYTAAGMGSTPRTISGFSWRYYTGGGALATTYPQTTIMMGHNTSGNVNTNFTGTFSDTPVTVVSSVNYNPAANSETNWISGPVFTGTFPYNGKDYAVLDIAQNGGTSINYWAVTTTSPSLTCLRQYTSGTTTYLNALSYNHDARFLYQVDSSEARSLWYDTGVTSPTILDRIVTQSVPPGTSVAVLFQGGTENPSIPGTVDPTTLTPWTSDPAADLSGYRFLRFYVDMKANIGSSTKPSLDEIRIAYIFF